MHEDPGHGRSKRETPRGACLERLKSCSIAISDRTTKVPQGAPHPSIVSGREAAGGEAHVFASKGRDGLPVAAMAPGS